MAADSVKAQLKLRMYLAGLQFIKKVLIDQPAVCINRTYLNLPFVQRIDDRHEILPDQRFSAGNTDMKHTAFRQLIRNPQELFQRRNAMAYMRSAHETMPAVQITCAGHRPLCFSAIMIATA